MLVLDIPVIAVTGSAGKTTTKEMIAAILQTRWNIFKSPRNHNTAGRTQEHAQIITDFHQALVLEYGMAYAGAIRQHCHYIQPNIGVITNIGTAHIGNFGGSVKRLAEAKSELIENMKADGTLFINSDDHNSRWLRLSGFSGKIIRIGIRRPAAYRAKNVTYYKNGMQFSVRIADRNHRFHIPIPGWHNVYNALLAIAVTTELGFSPIEIARGLRRYKRPGRRLTFKPGINGTTIIDDSYSSNPHALKSAVDVLTTVGKAPRIVVLGDMLQLGAISREKHQEIGQYLADQKLHYILTLGSKAEDIGKAALAQGFDPARVFHFTDRSALLSRLAELTSQGGTVLVKGSHDAKMGLIADFLTDL